MKQKLKFKAWHIETEKMYDVDCMYFDEDGVSNITLRNMVAYDTLEPLLGVNDVELIMCTGVLDAKGKEISVGDIIRIPNISDIVKIETKDSDVIDMVTGIVEYDDGVFMCNGATSGIVVTSDMVESFNLEVVGNIYENPSLI